MSDQHTPTNEERDELVRVISEAESATDDEGSWALPEDVADAILAVFHVTPKTEEGTGDE